MSCTISSARSVDLEGFVLGWSAAANATQGRGGFEMRRLHGLEELVLDLWI